MLRAWVIGGVAAVALLFAGLTRHVWEDYYITYRASKNLATGAGLVFNRGERLHTFTSPLGVLLPAAASLATGNRSDAAALWIFRLCCAAAFGGAALLLHASLRRLAAGAGLAALGVGLLATDLKSVDFTINGMETAFMLLFLAYAFWSLLGPARPGRWKHLGLAWAGLMWTRPDSFIYIGALAGAWLVFRARDAAEGEGAVSQLHDFARAGALCAALYLPWFLWAWWYYGSPIPHTIIAKSSVAATEHTPLGVLLTFLKAPVLVWNGGNTLEATFLPSYYMTGGWPAGFVWAARLAAFIAWILWLFPFVRREVRAASLAYARAHVYLSYFPYFPFPWYLCPTTLLAYLALLGAAAQAFSSPGMARGPRALPVLGLAALAVQVVLLVAGGWQVARMQRHIEDGNRRRIGEWLAQRAARDDRVFLEPLGYIGYFSGLKTYDWPGLSSPEVVATHRRVGPSWADIVAELRPNWLVLRPAEEKLMRSDRPDLLEGLYRRVQVFDVRAAVEAERHWGRRLLEMDAVFTLWRRDRDTPVYPESYEHGSKFPGLADVSWDRNSMMMVHAPGWIRMAVPRGAARLSLQFGFPPWAYSADAKTDGANFQVLAVVDGRERLLFERKLDPATRVEDRAVMFTDIDLPVECIGRGELILRTQSLGTETSDYTCWNVSGFW